MNLPPPPLPPSKPGHPLPMIAIPPPRQPSIIGERLETQPQTSELCQQQQQQEEQEVPFEDDSSVQHCSSPMNGEGENKRKSIRSPAIATMAANLNINFGQPKGKIPAVIGPGVVQPPQEERRSSLDLGVMGDWLKDGDQVQDYFEAKRDEEEEGSKKKKKGDKKAKKPTTVYGLSLKEMYEESGFPIPIVVAQCMSYLKQSDGLKLEGIFRISAPIREVDRLKSLYKDPTTIVNLSEETDNPHVIACLLKQYFTMMPDPLIPFSETDALVEAYQTNEENLPEMIISLTKIIVRLPFLEASLLRFLIQYLSQMGGYAEGNFMTADNLAICFGPNLIRFKNASAAMMGSQIEAKVTAVLIKNYSTIFEDIAEGDAPEIFKEKEKDKKKKKARPTSTIQPKLNATALQDSPSITESKRKSRIGKRVSQRRIRSQLVSGGSNAHLGGGIKSICPTCSKNVTPPMGKTCHICQFTWCCVECTRATKAGECINGGNHQFVSPRPGIISGTTSFPGPTPCSSFPPPSAGSPPSPTPSLSPPLPGSPVQPRSPPLGSPAQSRSLPPLPGSPVHSRSPPLGGMGFQNELMGALKARGEGCE